MVMGGYVAARLGRTVWDVEWRPSSLSPRGSSIERCVSRIGTGLSTMIPPCWHSVPAVRSGEGSIRISKLQDAGGAIAREADKENSAKR